MAKTQEELYAIKEEVEELNNKLKELSEDELKTVIGGLYNDNMECPQRTCTFNSKEECPHANYGRMRVSDCKYN